MDLAGRIQQLEDIVTEAKSMPLSSSVLVSREELLELIEEMKSSLPEEVKQARWVVKDREELLAKARTDAEQIVEQARQDQLRLSQQEEIFERAKHEAERILESADDESRRVRTEADDYVDAKLAQFENVLRKVTEDLMATSSALDRTLEQVETGRDRLHGAPQTAAEHELGEQAPPHEEQPLAPDLPEGDG
jgi:cell division septum initiation protein DivIVA